MISKQTRKLKLEIYNNNTKDTRYIQYNRLFRRNQYHKTMHIITKLWKFGLNRSSARAQWKKEHPCCITLCAYSRCTIKGFSYSLCYCYLFYYLSEKLPLCQKLHYFRGSRFSQCFIPSTSPHYLLPSKFLCQQLF